MFGKFSVRKIERDENSVCENSVAENSVYVHLLPQIPTPNYYFQVLADDLSLGFTSLVSGEQIRIKILHVHNFIYTTNNYS